MNPGKVPVGSRGLDGRNRTEPGKNQKLISRLESGILSTALSSETFMIRNQWYAVLSSREAGKTPVGVVRLGERLVFWRDSQKKIHCLLDDCCHRKASLSGGEVVHDRLQCPFHGLQYDAAGRVTLIPANSRIQPVDLRYHVQSYPTFEAHDLIWIFWGDRKDDIGEPQWFDDLDDSFSYAETTDPWPVHYTRCVENQLDVSHLPFVHRTTIGRGNRTVVDGPVVQWINPLKMRFFVFNRKDDGVPPLKPSEITPDIRKDFHLDLLFPNLWQNHIADPVRVVAAFAPVDEANTKIYLRFYQNFVRWKPLGRLLCRIAMPYNRLILGQDKAVVVTQHPVKSELKSGEELIQADLPILEFRKKREELKNRS